MEDKRIVKTKQNLKRTLIGLLRTTTFERITVSELCRVGNVSRITFYTHYEDKYALTEELFSDYVREADMHYHRLQDENNPGRDGVTGYKNLMEAILCLFYNNYDFFSHVSSHENPYLYAGYYNKVYHSVVDYIERHTALVPRYPLRQTATLLCSGFFAVVSSCAYEKLPEEKVRPLANAMYEDLLSSRLFIHLT